MQMSTAREVLDEYRQKVFEKFNETLRTEGFTEMQIAKIDTVVRRALGL